MAWRKEAGVRSELGGSNKMGKSTCSSSRYPGARSAWRTEGGFDLLGIRCELESQKRVDLVFGEGKY